MDNVRGQTPEFQEHEVETIHLTSAVTATDGPRVSLRLTGDVRLAAEGVWPVPP